MDYRKRSVGFMFSWQGRHSRVSAVRRIKARSGPRDAKYTGSLPCIYVHRGPLGRHVKRKECVSLLRLGISYRRCHEKGLIQPHTKPLLGFRK